MAELPDVGLIKVCDAETGYEEYVDTSSKRVRRAHELWWKNKQTRLFDMLSLCNVDSVSIRTDQDYVVSLMKLFAQRT